MGSGNPSSSGRLSPEGRVAKAYSEKVEGFKKNPYNITQYRHHKLPSHGAAIHRRSERTVCSRDHRFMPRISAMRWAFIVKQQQFQQQSQPPPPYMFSLRNNDTVTNTSTAATPGDVFFQRLGNPRAAASMGVSDHGYSAEGAVISSLVAPPSRPPSSSSNENRSNTFLF
ncbi:hypothetical protein OIU74_002764 [Salix koriyanagi]|uniref:Uncharacterized protein n=1 Tax=Salix koriyanagi TaxID=2511006 RepID=A0A9Q1AQ06_9ROSI|nr:hypothetical protein OIU74_002764 [Salix koriyanagi]